MNLLTAIRSEFQTTANSPEARRTLARIAASTPVLADYDNLADVVRAMHTAELTDQVHILNALIAHAPTEPVVRLTIVEAFARLVARYRRVTDPNDIDDYRSDLVAAVLTEVDRLAAQGPHPYPATMIARAVDRADKKWRRQADAAPLPVEDINDEINGQILIADVDADPFSPTRVDLFLDTVVAAVRAGELSQRDGVFIARRFLNGETISAEARRRFVCERVVRRQLETAIDTLARYHQANAA